MKILNLLFCFSAILTSCAKEEAVKPGNILVIGHGGNGFQSFTNQLPSNTITSVRKAIEGSGADGVEVDVQVSADEKLVLYHDLRLEHSTDCIGCIGSSAWDELKDCQYSTDMSNAVIRREKIALLEDVFSLYEKYSPKPLLFLDLRLNNECGEATAEEKMVQLLGEIIHQYDAWKWCLVESSSITFLQLMKQRFDNVRLYSGGYNDGDAETLKSIGIEGIVVSSDKIDVKTVDELGKKDLRVVLFDVKTQGSAREAVLKNPFAIEAENIEQVQEYCD